MSALRRHRKSVIQPLVSDRRMHPPPLIAHKTNVSLFLCSLQATMLKKNKIKRRNTEPSIPPANGVGGKSTDECSNKS